MIGVIANAVAILLGSLLGIIFKKLMPESLHRFIEITLGYCTIVVGLKMAMKFENVLLWVSCIGVGGIIGHLFHLEQAIENGAKKLQKLLIGGRESKFATGLTSASILFCVGGMAIIGPINSAVMGDHQVLFTKSILDGVISVPMAGIYGIGVAFSAIPLLLYQGGIALLAAQAQFLNQPHIINEISGVGGVLIMMIGINLSKISKVPVGDFLPAMLLVLATAFFIA